MPKIIAHKIEVSMATNCEGNHSDHLVQDERKKFRKQKKHIKNMDKKNNELDIPCKVTDSLLIFMRKSTHEDMKSKLIEFDQGENPLVAE